MGSGLPEELPVVGIRYNRLEGVCQSRSLRVFEPWIRARGGVSDVYVCDRCASWDAATVLYLVPTPVASSLA